MQILRKLMEAKENRDARKLARDDENCEDSKRIILTSFDRLIKANGYTLSFVGRAGRYRSECLFGLSADGIPRIIIGGETGPSTWIGHPLAAFDDLYDQAGNDWFNIGPVADFILDRGPRWLKDSESWGNYERGYTEQAATIISLWPRLLHMFSSQASIAEWQPGFETFANKAVETYWGQSAGT